MANIMLQYDRPTDTRNWTEYNGRVRDWIARLVQTPGAVSFIAYRTADGASPNTIAVLEFVRPGPIGDRSYLRHG
jgi:hypothetical protein